jgi:hypothetical protein
MLTVEGAPSSRSIATEFAVNIAGAALRKRSAVMGLTESQAIEIIKHIERWIEHGFEQYTSLTKDVANAYRNQLPGDTQQRQNFGMGWQAGFLRNHAELSELLNTSKSEEGHDSARNFFMTYQECKRVRKVPAERIYALEEAAYQTTIYQRRGMVFPRPKKQPKRTEERQFSSVIHCCSSRGRHLPPYIICRSKNPPQTRTFEGMQIASNETGWTEEAHASDWLRTVFEPETRCWPHTTKSNPWRILLVSRRFSVNPDFELYCWKNHILCLPFPVSDQKFFNPMHCIAFEAMKKSYTDTMMSNLAGKPYVTMEVDDFASWIKAEIRSSKRRAEATTQWAESCLVPVNDTSFYNRLQGKRATAMPDETSSITSRGASLPQVRFENPMVRTPRTSSCTPTAESTPRTSVPLPLIPTIEIWKRDSSVEQSELQLQESLQDDIGTPATDTEGDSSSDIESGSENDLFIVPHASQTVTPSRTPRRSKAISKAPKSIKPKSPKSEPSDSVMSTAKHLEILDDFLDGTPRTRKRFRDALMVDRSNLVTENAELKAKLDMMTHFISLKKLRTE